MEQLRIAMIESLSEDTEKLEWDRCTEYWLRTLNQIILNIQSVT